jgi:hypothetical protein
MVVDPSRTGYLTAVDYCVIARAAPLPGSTSPTSFSFSRSGWNRRKHCKGLVVPNARHVCELSHSSYFRVGGLRTPAPERAATSSWAGIRNPSHNQTHAPQQIGMLSSSVGGGAQRIRAGGKSLAARTIRRLPRLQCQGPLSIRVRCLAVQPDAAPTDQLDDAGSHGGLL